MSTNFPSTEEALYFVEDVLGRSMIPFVLLGDTAKFVYENLDHEVHTPIQVGITSLNLTEYAVQTLKMFLPADAVWTKKSIKFEHQGTPVTIKIIHRKYKVLENPDQVFYRITHFKIPNPFASYWKQRHLLQ